jgi:hypothetical protein
MDIAFAVIMLSSVLGPALLCLGALLMLGRRTRWFAAVVLALALAAGALFALKTELVPYTARALFWAGFTVVAFSLTFISAAVTGIVVAIDRWEHRHAA